MAFKTGMNGVANLFIEMLDGMKSVIMQGNVSVQREKSMWLEIKFVLDLWRMIIWIAGYVWMFVLILCCMARCRSSLGKRVISSW